MKILRVQLKINKKHKKTLHSDRQRDNEKDRHTEIQKDRYYCREKIDRKMKK